MFTRYIQFCFDFNVNYVDPDKDTLCAYIEYLAQRFTSHKSVTNYFSAVKLLHKYIGVSIKNYDCFEVGLMLRALPLTMRCAPKQKAPITVEMLSRLVQL